MYIGDVAVRAYKMKARLFGSTAAIMEYLHHLILLFVPEILIFLVVILSLVGLGKCKYLRKEVESVILGDQFLKHMPPMEDTRRRRVMCSHPSFLLAGSVLWWIVAMWWVTLVEQITVNKCVTGADCFITERPNYKFELINPDRVTNCSNYSLTDGMIICYKAGFYFFDACAKAGGALAIVSTVVKLYIPTIIACAKGQKMCFYIAGVITGCVAVLLIVAYVLLMLILPPNSRSDLLTLISGTSLMQHVPLLLAILSMSIATCTMSAQYHSRSEYKELPEN